MYTSQFTLFILIEQYMTFNRLNCYFRLWLFKLLFQVMVWKTNFTTESVEKAPHIPGFKRPKEQTDSNILKSGKNNISKSGQSIISKSGKSNILMSDKT